MYVWGLHISQLDLSIMLLNEWYDGNISYKEWPQERGQSLMFTITVKDSKGKGASINPLNGRKVKAACYHVHRDLFRELFRLGATRIKTRDADYRNVESLELDMETVMNRSCVGTFYGYIPNSAKCHCED